MKKFLISIWIFFYFLQGSEVNAQFTSGNSFFIGTTVSINGLVITPTFGQTELVNTEIVLSSQAIPGTPTSSINRVYTLNKPINILGKVGITYLPSELNGNTESMLELAYFNETERYVTTSQGVQDPANHFVSKDFNLVTATDMLKITAVNGTSALPVVLISFAAKKVENQAHLTWNTSSEINSDYFEVQRSEDGKQWTLLDQVQSNGESKSLQSYTYIDISPLTGENLYRLKMVDNDGSFAYSKVVNLNFDHLPQSNVYPNPVVAKLNIGNTDWKNVTKVEILNSSGQLVSASFSRTADPLVREYDFRTVPSGVYLVKIVKKNEASHTMKVFKK